MRARGGKNHNIQKSLFRSFLFWGCFGIVVWIRKKKKVLSVWLFSDSQNWREQRICPVYHEKFGKIVKYKKWVTESKYYSFLLSLIKSLPFLMTTNLPKSTFLKKDWFPGRGAKVPNANAELINWGLILYIIQHTSVGQIQIDPNVTSFGFVENLIVGPVR